MFCKRVILTLAAMVAMAVAAPPPMDQDMADLARMVRESCHAETGVDLALIDRINAGAPLMEDATLKCYTKCVMETAGMLGDGTVDVEVVLALLDPATRAKNEQMIRACGTQKGADDCDTAWRTQRCWQEGSPADYFLI